MGGLYVVAPPRLKFASRRSAAGERGAPPGPSQLAAEKNERRRGYRQLDPQMNGFSGETGEVFCPYGASKV
jgi:hypothetical protein